MTNEADKRDPKVGATVWSFVLTDYGVARDGWEDELDLPVRQAYSTRAAAMACAKAALLDWLLPDEDDWDPENALVCRETETEVYDDANWKQQDGEDLLWISNEHSPDEIRCRVYPVTIYA